MQTIPSYDFDVTKLRMSMKACKDKILHTMNISHTYLQRFSIFMCNNFANSAGIVPVSLF